MAKNKFSMTSEEQWHTMQSLLVNVANQLKSNAEQMQKYMDEAKDIDLSQLNQKAYDVMNKLYFTLGEDIKVIRDIVTIRNIENTAERSFNHSYRATTILCSEISSHVSMVAKFILENNISIDKFHEKNNGYSYDTLRELVSLLVSSEVTKLTEKKEEKNAD